MLKKKMLKALTRQINEEMYSGYLYLSMESYFHSISLSGFATWMRVQAQEELAHGMKFYDYVNERGGRVILDTINRPDSEWETPLVAFEQIMAHEEKVTALINGLMDLAITEQDHATKIFLQWFVSEQVEEESSVGGVLNKLRLIQNDSSGLFMLDAEMAKRVFVLPAKG
ncbi:MAG: ferritin [Candidatus Electrothrix sp. AX5]|uniref:Ferritin n=1 Tax=Candidatus Electrothrix aarhusensis TaxID=1859131 RepID=A0A3S3SK28_9BACT|nr:ferritin [Candidatus Electrothrix sp. AX5]RWX44495.1 ferritin [Candidatus Electrothrix aarhusensis]